MIKLLACQKFTRRLLLRVLDVDEVKFPVKFPSFLLIHFLNFQKLAFPSQLCEILGQLLQRWSYWRLSRVPCYGQSWPVDA